MIVRSPCSANSAACAIPLPPRTENVLARSLERDSLLIDRVERLMTSPAEGPITALIWTLEMDDVQRRATRLP
jgi:hypothetical protein